MSDNKQIANKAKNVLKELGYDVKLSHVYEVLSKLSGHNSWNVASAADAKFSKLLTSVAAPVAIATGVPNAYEVKIKSQAEVRKYYRIAAENEDQAKQIMLEYLDVQSGEIDISAVKWSQTLDLLETESASAFKYGNWEVIDNDEPKIADIYSLKNQ